MKYLLLLLLLISCSSLVPSLPNMSTSVGSSAAPTTAVGTVMKETTDSVFQWAWLSILLVIFFPSMRAPIVSFLKALFFILALPLEIAHKHITMLYNNKYNNGKET